jgi:hypothetical protein
MAWRSESIESRLLGLDKELAALRLPAGSPVAPAIARWRADAAALRFTFATPGERPRVIAILGGTGTGKSTLVNRLLNSNLSAASFRRTYTAGAVAIAQNPKAVPAQWLGVDHDVAQQDQLPARGEADRLIIVPAEQELTKHVTLIDTPDLDGDQPAHHAQADRAFRWAQGIVFLVTPEKYQMTELLPVLPAGQAVRGGGAVRDEQGRGTGRRVGLCDAAPHPRGGQRNGAERPRLCDPARRRGVRTRARRQPRLPPPRHRRHARADGNAAR